MIIHKLSSNVHLFYPQPRLPVPTTAGSAPTASTSVTVLGLLHVINTMVPVAQAVTRTGLDLPVNMVKLGFFFNDPFSSDMYRVSLISIKMFNYYAPENKSTSVHIIRKQNIQMVLI